MGDIAEMMLGGILCEMCGSALDCDECSEMDIPMYCSEECANDRGGSIDQVCTHEGNRCGKPHNNAEGEESCAECQAIKLNL
jgi:hypothetical protein